MTRAIRIYAPGPPSVMHVEEIWHQDAVERPQPSSHGGNSGSAYATSQET